MNEKAKKIATIGWFATPNKPGDRTLEQQMTGLDKVLAEVAGKTVIDAGCAEGLISMEMAKAGAVKCVGLEVIAGHVELGKALVGDLPVELKVANLNDFDLSALEPADIVLMLAVLHKLKDPSAVCANLAALAKDLCVIRLPPYGPVIVDARSGNEPHDIDAVMKAMGFALESATTGPFDEWLAYYRRPVTITNAPPAGMVPTGVVLTEGDAAADMAGEPRPDKPGRSSWAEASAEPAPAEPEAKPPEQAAAEEADRVAETGDTTPSVDPTEPPPNQGEGIHTGQPLLGARRSRAKKSDDAA